MSWNEERSLIKAHVATSKQLASRRLIAAACMNDDHHLRLYKSRDCNAASRRNLLFICTQHVICDFTFILPVFTANCRLKQTSCRTVTVPVNF